VKLEIDPKLSQLYEILKQKGKISKDMSFNEFVNQFVLNYIRNRFGITLAVVEGMDGEPTYKIVEDKGEEGIEKTMEEVEKTLRTRLKAVTLERMLKSLENPGTDFNINQIIQPLLLLRLLPPENVNKSDPEINARIARLESMIEKLAEERKTNSVRRDKFQSCTALILT
jgi:hypothetical protein